MDNTAKSAKDVAGLKVTSLTFQHNDYGENRGQFTATANLRRASGSYEGMRDVTLALDPSMATEIMRLLAPIMAKQAAKASQELADESIALSNAIADAVVKSIEDHKPE